MTNVNISKETVNIFLINCEKGVLLLPHMLAIVYLISAPSHLHNGSFPNPRFT